MCQLLDKAYEFNGIVCVLFVFCVRLLPSLENVEAVPPPLHFKNCYALHTDQLQIR